MYPEPSTPCHCAVRLQGQADSRSRNNAPSHRNIHRATAQEIGDSATFPSSPVTKGLSSLLTSIPRPQPLALFPDSGAEPVHTLPCSQLRESSVAPGLAFRTWGSGGWPFPCSHKPPITSFLPSLSSLQGGHTQKMRSKGGYLVLAEGAWNPFTAQTLAEGDRVLSLPRQTVFFTHTGTVLPLSPMSFLETPPGWQGGCAGPFKNHPTPPLEGWPRRVDSETAFVLVQCPGCSWREDGGGGGWRRRRRRKGGVDREGAGFQRPGAGLHCAFPLGKGPQDA